MSLIIDCHGHYTTAPKALETWRNQQIAGIKDPTLMPKVSDLKISDDELLARDSFPARCHIDFHGCHPCFFKTLATSAGRYVGGLIHFPDSLRCPPTFDMLEA